MKYGLVGEKLGHSFSKVIHEYFAQYEYDLCEIPLQEINSFFIKKEFKAINITIPYKEVVIPHLNYIDESAEKIGAVNTVVNKKGKLFGYNTDFGGLRKLILKNNFDFKGKKVLILGSGGTSKTAFAVSSSLGAESIVVVSRNGEINYKNVKKLHSDCDFIINTTPCGMFPNSDSSAIDLVGFKKLSGVIDVVYNPLKTKLVLQAESMGIKACGGLYMLVSQAILASEYFCDKKYDEKTFDETYKYVLSKKQNIVLTGMPGSGKSTIGKALSERLSMPFIDTDELIVENEGIEIPEIFSRFGEKYFRDAETQAIKQVSSQGGLIIATGGGAVLKEKNIQYLKSNGKIFFLNRPIEDIVPTESRPLSSNYDDLKKRFSERYDIYKSTAEEEVFVNGDVETAVRIVLEKLK